jgi:hypothetical protein
MRAPAPQQVPLVGSITDRLSALAAAISRKADNTLEPTYAAVMLSAPDGSTWKLTVDATGALHTAQVPRP